MGVTSTVDDARSAITIAVSGHFDFSLHEEFRRAYEDVAEPGCKVEIDMRHVDYMDSSALGMLLLLREHVGEDEASIRVVNCTPEIRNILKVSNFEKLFEIE